MDMQKFGFAWCPSTVYSILEWFEFWLWVIDAYSYFGFFELYVAHFSPSTRLADCVGF